MQILRTFGLPLIGGALGSFCVGRLASSLEGRKGHALVIRWGFNSTMVGIVATLAYASIKRVAWNSTAMQVLVGLSVANRVFSVFAHKFNNKWSLFPLKFFKPFGLILWIRENDFLPGLSFRSLNDNMQTGESSRRWNRANERCYLGWDSGEQKAEYSNRMNRDDESSESGEDSGSLQDAMRSISEEALANNSGPVHVVSPSLSTWPHQPFRFPQGDRSEHTGTPPSEGEADDRYSAPSSSHPASPLVSPEHSPLQRPRNNLNPNF